MERSHSADRKAVKRDHRSKKVGRGRKTRCLCGKCFTCKHRARYKKYYQQRREGYTRAQENDGDLELRLIEYFLAKGWD